MLIIVETLNELCTVILVHHITVYMDHKNLKYDNFTIERVLIWHLLLEEYVPTIKYIKGPDNYESRALIRLLLIKSDIAERNIARENLSEIYCVSKFDGGTLPLTYQMIDKYHQKDK